MQLTSLILKIFLILSFFISFALNIEKWNWGLQISWIFGSLLILSQIINFKYISFKINLVYSLFYVFVIISILNIILLELDLIIPPIDSEYSITRCIAHTAYIIIYYLISRSIYQFLIKRSDAENFEKYITIYPFLIISLYGCYQILSTYDILPYTDIFNNSLSTGFTYYRFKEDHRVSAVFAEPSEYSYYLCFITPIIYRYIRFGNNSTYKNSLFSFLLITQIIFIKSLTFLIGLPLILIIIIFYIEKIKPKNLLIIGSIFIILIFTIVYMNSDRIYQIIDGQDGSVNERLENFIISLSLFYNNIYTGFGYGGIRGVDGISFILSSFGIIGSLTIFFIITKVLNVIYNYDKVIAGSIFAMIFSSLSSSNIFDYIFIWVVLVYFYTIASTNKFRNLENCK